MAHASEVIQALTEAIEAQALAHTTRVDEAAAIRRTADEARAGREPAGTGPGAQSYAG